jgi:excisionase family DNA binding protein
MTPGSVGKDRSQNGRARNYRIEADSAINQEASAFDQLARVKDIVTTSQGDRLVFTEEEAAYLLNISHALAKALVARGEIPAIRLGRRIAAPRRQLEIVLEGTNR